MPLDEDVVAAIYCEHGAALRRLVLSASRGPAVGRGRGPGDRAARLAACPGNHRKSPEASAATCSGPHGTS